MTPTNVAASARKAVVAWLVASFANVLAVWFVFIIAARASGDVQAEVDWVASALHVLFLFVVFGYPISLFLTGLVAVPANQYLNRRGAQALRRILLTTGALGTAVVSALWLTIDGPFRPFNLFALVVSGVFVGFSGTMTYWLVIREPSGVGSVAANLSQEI